LPVPAWCGRLLRVVAPWPGCGAQECVLPCCRPGRGAFSRMPGARGRCPAWGAGLLLFRYGTGASARGGDVRV